jgi:N-acyl-D-amino-acid deacylase
VLGRYVREEHVVTLEEAIAKMTGRAAERLGLADRGAIVAGRRADIVIFDASTVADRGTPQDPAQPPVGIETVIVNGAIVLDGSVMTAARPGRALRRTPANAHSM